MAPQEQAIRLAVFCHETGISPNDVACSAFASVPAPVYREESTSWRGVRPEALWHPLFWLPPHLARRVILDDGITQSPENDEVWLTRLAIELTTSGVYDEDEGTWIDVLARAGLDIDDPQDLARVAAWQEGNPDPVLDSIDLSDLMQAQDPQQSVPVAWSCAEQLRPVAWYIHATALGDDIAGFVADNSAMTPQELASALRTLCSIAASSFEGLGPDVVTRFATLAQHCLDPDAALVEVAPQAQFMLAEIAQAWAEYAHTLADLDPEEDSPWDSEVDWGAAPPASRT